MPRKQRLTITRDDRHGLYYVFLDDRSPASKKTANVVTRTEEFRADNGALVLVDFNVDVVMGIEITL